MPPFLRALLLPVLVAGTGLAAAQPPTPPGGGPGSGSLPPLKQKQIGDEERDGDRQGQPRPRRAGAPLPSMNGLDMSAMEPPTEEPVTASGNIDLWRARLAERRARQDSAATSSGGAPR